jgi:hypothetical protein
MKCFMVVMLLVVGCLIVVGCGTSYVGIYKSTNMDMTLELKVDGTATYTLFLHQLDEPFMEDQGTYKVEGEQIVFLFDDGRQTKYEIIDGGLSWDGPDITLDSPLKELLEDMFPITLKKQNG